MRVSSLSEIDDRTLHEMVGSDPPVIFVGSGISLWSPSNLPTGIEFSKSIFSLLFSSDPENAKSPNAVLLRRYFEMLPFEVVNDRCPDANTIETILRNLYDRNEPNPIHELLAELLLDGRVRAIVTPNYDCCLDTAIALAQQRLVGSKRNVVRIVNGQDFNMTRDPNTAVYFKIHGSTDDQSGESLVFRLNQEGVLEQWKRELFRDLLQDKTLLVVGYSGSDFDICPEIPLAKPKKIVWNFFSWADDNITPNIKFLSERCKLEIISGDMRDLFSRVFDQVHATYGLNRTKVDHLLDGKFDENTKRLWRIRLYNSINYNRATITEMNNANQNQSGHAIIPLLTEHAAALASSGRYRDAARIHDKTAKIAQTQCKDSTEYITQILIACDTWRCYGSFLRAFNRYRKATLLIQKSQHSTQNLIADLDRNLILLIRHPYDFFQRFHMPKLEKKMQKIAADAISRNIAYYRESGNWYQLQQIGLWAERFQLNVNVDPQKHVTPAANEGYRQLNFPMGQMMSFRHSLRNLDRLLTTSEVDEARRLIGNAKELGITPEVWKSSLLILRKADKNDRTLGDFIEFVKAFTSCQYALLFGIWRILMGE